MFSSKINFIQGNSGTGKTTFISALLASIRKSGYKLECEYKCYLLSDDSWKYQIERVKEISVFCADEGFMGLKSNEFAKVVKKANHYFVIVSRKCYPQINYSVDDLFELRMSGNRWHNVKRFNISADYYDPVDLILTEDRRAGAKFFKVLSDKLGIRCVTTKGKSNMVLFVSENQNLKVLVIVDLVSYGNEIINLYPYLKSGNSIQILDSQSFEHLVLTSQMFEKSVIPDLLNAGMLPLANRNLEDYYTKTLEDLTKHLPCSYDKNHLSACYTQNCCCKGTGTGPCKYKTSGDKLKIILSKHWNKFWFSGKSDL
jgi:hypothetical protein